MADDGERVTGLAKLTHGDFAGVGDFFLRRRCGFGGFARERGDSGRAKSRFQKVPSIEAALRAFHGVAPLREMRDCIIARVRNICKTLLRYLEGGNTSSSAPFSHGPRRLSAALAVIMTSVSS